MKYREEERVRHPRTQGPPFTERAKGAHICSRWPWGKGRRGGPATPAGSSPLPCTPPGRQGRAGAAGTSDLHLERGTAGPREAQGPLLPLGLRAGAPPASLLPDRQGAGGGCVSPRPASQGQPLRGGRDRPRGQGLSPEAQQGESERPGAASLKACGQRCPPDARPPGGWHSPAPSS